MNEKRLLLKKVLIIAVILTGCTNQQFEHDQEMPEEKVNVRSSNEPAWDFPVKPGTEEYNRFTSLHQVVDACQIPPNVLTSLSTEDLAVICLNYPLLFLFTLYNHWDAGLDAQFKDFNGLRELFKRNDVTQALLKQYQLQIQSLQDLKNPEVIPFIIIEHEALLCRLHTCNQLTNEDYVEVLRQLVIGYESLLMYPETFGVLSFSSNFFARAHILEKINPGCLIDHIEMGKNNFVFGGLPDRGVWEYINELSYPLIANKQ